MSKKLVIKDSQIILSVKELVELIQIQTKNNIVEKSRDLTIDKKDLAAIVSVADASIMNAFTVGIDNVVKNIKKWKHLE